MTAPPADMERQYVFRDRHPDRAAVQAAYGVESDRVRARLGGRLDLVYDDAPGGRLDLFAPDGAGRSGAGAPLLIFLHGGYWRSHVKEDYVFVAEPFVEAGIAVAVVEYGLAPAATLDGIVAQTRRALLWLRAQAPALGLDPGRLFVGGHSAGGHLAAMLALTDWPALGAPPDLVKGLCAVSGLFDLAPIRETSINRDLGLDAEAALRNSPTALPAGGAGWTILAWGEDETPEFPRQSRLFAEALRRAGRPCRLVPLAGLHHYNVVLELGRDGALTRAVVAAIAASADGDNASGARDARGGGVGRSGT